MAGMTNENFDEKMMQRALGLVEGIAFGLGEGARDVLLGAAEDIDSGIKALESRVKEAADEFDVSEELIHKLLKDKDDLLTKNDRLRDMLEKMATEGGAEEECDGEIATSAVPPCNDSGCLKVQTDNPSVACGDSSPYTGEPLGAEDGCDTCAHKYRLCDYDNVNVYVSGRTLITERNEWRNEAEIRFCPVCGRKL